jgi:glycosyltransferase involved in cell wall biosynthesis
MPVTIGCVANVYNEIHSLPGWLESACAFFDDVRVLHAGPGGVKSNDGTIELLEKWKIPVEFCAIDDGFGVVRTRAIRMSPCDWVMILDADERFHHLSQVMTCGGESTPPDEVNTILQSYDFRDLKTLIPNWENVGRLGAKLSVSYGDAYNQGAWLREVVEYGDLDAVMAVRRHWHDFTRKRPTQNWHTDPDYQMRLVRNKESVYFDPGTKMHERLCGASNVYRPNFTHGPFFDHYHFTFKRLAQENRAHAIRIYDAIHEGRKPPTWEEFNQ